MGLLTVLFGFKQVQFAMADRDDLPREQITAQLDSRISAIWKGQDLGVVFDRLAAAQGISFWVDRRVDLQQPIEGDFRDATLREVLNTLTKDESLGWADLGNICYVGPQGASREVATLLELAKDSVGKLPPQKGDLWMNESATRWPRLSEPRMLLSEWLQQQGIGLEHAGLINHDLWKAMELPPMPLVERVVLLLIGFDLTCQISPDGHKCIVVPIQRPVTITRNYDADRKSRSAIKHMRREAPGIQIVRQDGAFSATGRWEDHKRLMEYLSGSTPVASSAKPSQKVQRRQLFSLRLKNQPLGKVINQLAQQLGLEVVWEKTLLERTPNLRHQLVSCEVQEAELSTLLHAIVDPVGIEYHLEDDKLTLY